MTAFSQSFAPKRMVGQPLDLVGQAVGIEPLDGFDDPGVEGAPPLLEQAAVGDLVGQRMLEGVLQVRKEAGLVQELGGLQAAESAARRLRRRSATAWSSVKRHVLPTTAAVWSRRLSPGDRRSMRAASTACTVAGTWMVGSGCASR